MTDDDLLAAEFALGLLDNDEAEAVRARAMRDAALTLRIAWWRDQLAPLAGEAEKVAPDRLWARIEAAIPGNDNVDHARMWKWATGGLGLVAAALLVFVTTRSPVPTPIIARPAAPMIAALSGEKGSIIAISYDSNLGKLTIAPTTLDPGKGDAELWVIPVGGKPVSLGVIDAKTAREHNIPVARRTYLQPGATFAITQEAKNGSSDGSPHGPIVASGKIIRA